MIVDQPIGGAVLYVSSNVQPEAKAAFSEWCDSIHHFDTMRIDGFLSLRRFELVDGIVDGGTDPYRLLTLYQVEAALDADFDTPAYRRHTATYTPPPDGVVDGITFERTVYERAAPVGGVQRVGRACVSLVGAPGSWGADVAGVAGRVTGVLSSTVATNADGALLLVDVVDVVEGRAVLDALVGIDVTGRRSLQLFEQVFPEEGVLVRERRVLAADAGT